MEFDSLVRWSFLNQLAGIIRLRAGVCDGGSLHRNLSFLSIRSLRISSLMTLEALLLFDRITMCKSKCELVAADSYDQSKREPQPARLPAV